MWPPANAKAPDMTWDESLRLAKVTDRIRDVGGLSYSPPTVKAVPLN